ncbi:MAG: Glutamine amidotransferase HisH [Candidatus Methanohalarchaeum thermophilum]|uniref:Imidazole glycerol phosphate synthase subunit HisH n=1 Tax=Methanohalarchaeum thermophilum TaxID=1903181 RepID=A0A1Q6DTL6_METT1|nr:MAG: Glutamine amidotransferase HisH [Candidatus Methanohalarchaeum thermophilum]
MSPEISIIDYGLGNIKSIRKGLEEVGATTVVTENKKDLNQSDGIVIPGVGAFEDGMKEIESLKYTIYDNIESGKPILGICLGMQMFLTKSQEGKQTIKGLDLIRGEAKKLPDKVKVPHIGWNSINLNKEHWIFNEIPGKAYFYFVHSYYSDLKYKKDILSTTDYGIRFPSAISRKNVTGLQFHPEKSGENGLKILENYVKYVKR